VRFITVRFEVLATVLLKGQAPAMWYCVIGRAVLDVWKDHTAFIFRVK
jgi:hypothetical protein